ncbi:MAG: hypothetical protein KDD69_01060 [Bdellovibrionales bacterium]|nr:hypothetical protein [Bdellovibrionales bacterium]
MKDEKVRQFLTLAGQQPPAAFTIGTPEQRRLGAQLLLSEVLEYVIHGLGVTPIVQGVAITDPNDLKYEAASEPDELEMLDGLADVAYTMFWNSSAFGLPLREAYELVCDNNLEKFVALTDWAGETGPLPNEAWHCEREVEWPQEVVSVEVLLIADTYFAVGKDASGKVRKPAHYRPVDLSHLLSAMPEQKKVANS